MACVVPAAPVSHLRMGAKPRAAPSARRSVAARAADALRRAAVAIAVVVGLIAPCAVARTSVGTIAVDALPPQGRAVLAAIEAGGPFAFPRDGIVFANREGLLPNRPRGYYAEYTVPTPGDRTRGARRIIAGKGATGDVRTSGEYYYTNDHYQSFRRIVQ